MNNDLQIRHEVQAALEAEPFDARGVAVAVKNHAVTLGGRVRSAEDSRLALAAVQSVEGVQAISNELVVLEGKVGSIQKGRNATSVASSAPEVPRCPDWNRSM